MIRSATPRTTPDGFEPGAVVSRLAEVDVSARLAAASYDSAARTVNAVFSTGARVRRWGIVEELAISPEAVDLSRVAANAVRLLDSHNAYSMDSVLGAVTSARIEGGQLVGSIRFADSDGGRRAEALVAAGDLTGISVGYRVTSWTLAGVENDVEIWRAERWELLEVSLVAVPADPAAMVRTGSAHPHQQQEDDAMRRNVPSAPAAAPTDPAAAPAPAPAAPSAPAPDTRAAPVAPALDADAITRAERTRVTEIQHIGATTGMPADAIAEAVRSGTPLDDFRRTAINDLAARSDRNPPHGANGVGQSSDDPDVRRRTMSEALATRMQESTGARVTPSEQVRQYMGLSIAELAATAMGERRMPRTAREHVEVLERAFHTTSDFPIIFSTALNARLEAAYQAAQPTYRRISRRSDFVDFRPHDIIRAGDFPMLQPVTQAGEIKFGTFGEKKETIAVAPYGIQVAFTRQMLVNDALGAIDQVLAGQGTTIALFEELTFFKMKGTVGPALKEDNKAVFHTDHGNLASSGGSVSVATLSAGRAAVRKQKRLDGNLMNLAPRLLLVGPDSETEAEKVTAQVQPNLTSGVNPFSGKLEVIVTGQIPDYAWELYPDLAFGANWQWGLLDGFTAPRMRVDTPFGQQGVGVSLEHDFGCGPVDFRFGYRNPGAAPA